MRIRATKLACLAGVAGLCAGVGGGDLITIFYRAARRNAVDTQISIDFNNITVQTEFRTSPLDLGPFTLGQVGGPGSPDGNVVAVGPFDDAAFFQTPNALIYFDDSTSVELKPDRPLSAWGADFADFTGDA